MPSTELVGGTVGEVNVGLAAALGFLNPLGAQIDAFLALSLGPLQAEISASLNASLQVAANIGLSIGDPFVALNAAIAAVGQLQAALTAALALPPISFSASAQLSATLSLAAALQLKLGLLDFAVQALLKIKIPALQLAASLTASLSAGPIVLMEVTNATLAGAGTDIKAAFDAGVGGTVLPPSEVIAPGDGPVTVFMMVTQDPGASAALSAVLT